jgi:hypothetical protein
MKNRFLWGSILAAALVGALIYLYGGSQVPADQAALETVTPQTLSAIKDQFNTAGAEVRVLVLRSPT